MGAEANIFQAYLQPPKSVADYGAELDKRDLLKTQLQGAQRTNALADLTVQQQIQANNLAMQKQSALQALYSDPNIRTQVDRENAMLSHPLLMDIGQAAQKARLDAAKVAADAGKAQADTAETQVKTAADDFALRTQKANKAIADITSLNSPQEALASLQAHYQAGDLDQNGYQATLSTLQPALQDPRQFGQWQRQRVLAIMDAKDRIAATAPKVTMANAGGSLVPVNENADAGPVGRISGAAPVPITQSADNAATQATSRANNAANISKDYAVAGINPDGTPNANQQKVAAAIGRGDLPVPTGMALTTPRGWNMLGSVIDQNPNFDFTSTQAKKSGAVAFGSGPQGNAMRSFATAGQHLDQLGKLADALDNGKNQTVNQVGNAIATWNGATPVTDFSAAKDVVSKEVIKAIVGGGGGVAEREELAKSLSAANSPAQLKGVIKQYRDLMSAQHENLLQQRRALGLPDSTLPNYNAGSAGAVAPASGWTVTPASK